MRRKSRFAAIARAWPRACPGWPPAGIGAALAVLPLLACTREEPVPPSPVPDVPPPTAGDSPPSLPGDPPPDPAREPTPSTVEFRLAGANPWEDLPPPRRQWSLFIELRGRLDRNSVFLVFETSEGEELRLLHARHMQGGLWEIKPTTVSLAPGEGTRILLRYADRDGGTSEVPLIASDPEPHLLAEVTGGFY